MAMYNKTLGKFQLVGIPPAPQGMPQIEVAFDIDANGIINVSAKDLGTGNEQQIKIEGGSGLNENEVQQMIKDAEAHADEAHKLRELADARNAAESLAYQTEKSLQGASRQARRVGRLDGRGPDHGAPRRARVGRRRRDQGEDRRAAGGMDGGGLGDLRAGVRVGAGCAARDGDGAAPDDEVIEDADYEVVDEESERRESMDRAAEPESSSGRGGRRARAASTRERDEYLDALQRLKAEFENYRKRVARDQGDLVARASERLVKQLLPVLDDLERALEAAERARGGAARGRRPARPSRARRRAREGGPRRGRDRRARSTRTRRRRCSRSRPRRRRAPSSRCCRRATGSATACCGRRASSSARARRQERDG